MEAEDEGRQARVDAHQLTTGHLNAVGSEMSLQVVGTPVQSLALTNRVFIAPNDFALASSFGDPPTLLEFGGYVMTAAQDERVQPGCVGLNSIQRGCCQCSQDDVVKAKVVQAGPFAMYPAQSLTWTVNPTKDPRKRKIEIDGERLQEHLREHFRGQIMSEKQELVIDFMGKGKFVLKVLEVEMLISADDGPRRAPRGMVGAMSVMYFDVAGSHPNIVFQNAPEKPKQLMKDFNLKELGIGGLTDEFSEIFRRAFSTRMFPREVMDKMGIQHVKGILIHGGPGTGKTLIARKIGEMLNAKEPKVINGPEILNKFVGESEAKVRELFADAEVEYAERGNDSDLHILIFLQIDAICKQRGSGKDSTGVGDTVVNQMLSKMDGVNSLNNILVIGITNRKDLIDSALLRPGRFEVHIELGLPTLQGRLEIFEIHTAKMRANDILEADVGLDWLARETVNYSGAEIEGLVKSAASYALNRIANMESMGEGKRATQEEMMDVHVTRDDFVAALQEVKPAFGAEDDVVEESLKGGIIEYGPAFSELTRTAQMFVKQVAESDKTPLMSILLEGERNCGKSALAAHLAQQSGFGFVKMIDAFGLLGYSESKRCDRIESAFDQAYKSPNSIVVLDDLERLLEYVPIGPRFSNEALQTLLVLLAKVPPNGRRLLVIATTSKPDIIADVGLTPIFQTKMTVPVQPQTLPPPATPSAVIPNSRRLACCPDAGAERHPAGVPPAGGLRARGRRGLRGGLRAADWHQVTAHGSPHELPYLYLYPAPLLVVAAFLSWLVAAA